MTALDPLTGRVLWRHRHALPRGHVVVWPNRGVAVGQNVVVFAAHDGMLLGLDARTGSVRWQQRVADHRQGYALAVAPLFVRDKVIVGATIGQRAVRGFLDAYEIRTGRRAWRFWTIPEPGEFGSESWPGESWRSGGAGAWMTGSFDPDLNLLYWGTGNPTPVFDGEPRRGDNLYANSLLALDPDAGTLKWHFQFTPHDVWDWDGCHIPILVDHDVQGRSRKLVVLANKNGHYYALDRETGKFLFAKAFVNQNWTDGFDQSGRPQVRKSAIPTTEWIRVVPTLLGGTNWNSPTYSPITDLFYVNVRDGAMRVRRVPAPLLPGEVFNWGGATDILRDDVAFHGIKALQIDSGEPRWTFRVIAPTMSGLLSTAGNIVFGGSSDGNFFALDAQSGKPLWHFQLGSDVSGNPVTYQAGGVQYVATPAGATIVAFTLPAAVKGVTAAGSATRDR